MNNNADIQSILTEFNYPFKDCGAYIQFAAAWRGGQDPTSVAFYKDKQLAKDFVTGETYGIKKLIALIIGDETKTAEYLKGKLDLDLKQDYRPKIKMPQIFDREILKELIPSYEYWEKRGISKEICQLYNIGLCLKSDSIMGKMKGRSVIPVFNSNQDLIGLVGRDITGEHRLKYKILGQKSNFIFNALLNGKIIKEKQEVILIESPADSLYLHGLGIRNTLCLFGTECSFPIINYLLKINPKKVIISTNQEQDTSGIGNRASEKIFARLKKYFDLRQLEIRLPYKKDFCDMSISDIKTWYEK